MNKKIILIEDDKDLQEIIKYNFSKEKYDVVLCSDGCLLYTSPSPRDAQLSRMPSSA